MKTFHRLLYDALEPLEFQALCRVEVTPPTLLNSYEDFESKIGWVIYNCFIWNNTPQGYDYWREIFDRFEEKEGCTTR